MNSQIDPMLTPARHRLHRQAAFTLVEVVLAVVIALGILVVLLHFYNQATRLRSQAIEQTEQVAAVRLVMDRMTADLRAFKPASDSGRSFTGSSNTIEFVKTDVPSFAAWSGGTLGRAEFPATDLKLVRYQLEAPGLTHTGGLIRVEEPLVKKRGVPLASANETADTNAVPVPAGPPVIQEIQFLQFRYWNGASWLDSWSSSEGPRAVEISLAAQPVTNETATAETALDLDTNVEVFRRVVALAEPALARNQSSSRGVAGPEEDAAGETEEEP